MIRRKLMAELVDRQVAGLRERMKVEGINIPDHLWELVLKKKSMPLYSPVQWDWGSRDMAEARPNFMAQYERVLNQQRDDPNRLKRFWIYELDRFGVKGPRQWFRRCDEFDEHGCKIISVLEGDLTGDEDDLKGMIEALFKTRGSREEQHKIAKRVAGQVGEMAKAGRDLGQVPTFGYDQGCFDAQGNLVWRLHYLDRSERIQIFPDGSQVQFDGKENHPVRATSQHYAYVPSFDVKRQQCVLRAFQIYHAEAGCISFAELARRLQTEGFASYKGRPFDKGMIEYMLENPTYVGYRVRNRTTKAKFFFFRKEAKDGNHLERRPDELKNKERDRPREEWIFSDERKHEPLVDDELFEAVQVFREQNRWSGTRAPRNDDGWLKPLLYCGHCGKQMVCGKSNNSKRAYICASYCYKYQRFRAELTCKRNMVLHERIEALVMGYLEKLGVRLVLALEQQAERRLEEEVALARDEALRQAELGFKDYLFELWGDLELETHPGPLADLVRESLKAKDISTDEQMDALLQCEKLKVPMARHLADQAEEEHADVTLATTRRAVSDRQKAVMERRLAELEATLDVLAKHLRPYDERKEQATARYQEKLDQLEAVRRAMKAGSNRMRGAAVARLFSRIVVRFDQTRKRGGWLPDETEFHLWHVKEAVRHALIDQLTEVEEEFLHLGDVKRLIAESDIPGLSVDAEDEKSRGKPSDRSGWSAGRPH